MSLFEIFFPSVKKEKVLIMTEDLEIRGWLYNAGKTKYKRLLSNLLNRANKNFVAITDCTVEHRNRQGEIEKLDFLQLNMKYIILIRPLKDEE